VPRSQFLFYMLPAVPFMCLGVAAILRALPRRAGSVAGVACIVISAITAVLYLPSWTSWSTTASWLSRLRLLRHWPLTVGTNDGAALRPPHRAFT
jgi:dolichyl-phosphate-mannose--protein O-mannosyl transferase